MALSQSQMESLVALLRSPDAATRSQGAELVAVLSEADFRAVLAAVYNLSGLILSGRRLSGICLRGHTLRETDLAGADLSGADLTTAVLIGADLSYADLSGADLSGADLRSAKLVGVDLTTTRLTRARLHNADLSGADLSGLRLPRLQGIGLRLAGADLSGAMLQGADLRSGRQLVRLHRANLTDADLSGAMLQKAVLTECTATRARLAGARLDDALLAGVDMVGANLSRARLRRTRLLGVDLTHADLRGAVLSWCTLRSAELTDADLRGASVTRCQYPTHAFRRARTDQTTRLRLPETPRTRAPMNNTIYLDHNATTPLHPAVLDAMTQSLREHWGNPSSSHPIGRRAKDAMETARAEVAALIGAQSDEIVFTSGGTEASNLAIRGAAALRSGALVTSAVEHPATARPLALLSASGREVVVLPVDGEGRVAADAPLPEEVALLTVMHANNEVGTLQPIAALARRCGGLVHTDAAQSLGKVPVDVDALGVDLLTIAGHKLYAPKGIGALYVRRGVNLPPLLLGAGHERGLRPGTENVASIVGLGVACRLAGAALSAEQARLTGLRERLWGRLSASIPGLKRNSPASGCLPNTLNLSFPGVSGSAVLARSQRIAASTGSACHEHGEDPSAVLLAMGLPAREALGAVRLSLGRTTTAEHVDVAADALASAWRVL